jgi:anti-sigma-K factor RskA
VIFPAQNEFQDMFVSVVEAAPDDLTPLDAVARALHSVAADFEERLPWSRKRQRVIDANPGLQERELIKLAGVATAIAATLRERGVAEPTASLTGQSAIAVFHVGFAQWIAPENTRPFTDIITESLAALKVVTAGA